MNSQLDYNTVQKPKPKQNSLESSVSTKNKVLYKLSNYKFRYGSHIDIKIFM